MICLDKADPLPLDMEGYSGLVMMGGPMSVNDDLPWIQQELELIRKAMLLDLPVLGALFGRAAYQQGAWCQSGCQSFQRNWLGGGNSCLGSVCFRFVWNGEF